MRSMKKSLKTIVIAGMALAIIISGTAPVFAQRKQKEPREDSTKPEREKPRSARSNIGPLYNLIFGQSPQYSQENEQIAGYTILEIVDINEEVKEYLAETTICKIKHRETGKYFLHVAINVAKAVLDSVSPGSGSKLLYGYSNFTQKDDAINPIVAEHLIFNKGILLSGANFNTNEPVEAEPFRPFKPDEQSLIYNLLSLGDSDSDKWFVQFIEPATITKDDLFDVNSSVNLYTKLAHLVITARAKNEDISEEKVYYEGSIGVQGIADCFDHCAQVIGRRADTSTFILEQAPFIIIARRGGGRYSVFVFEKKQGADDVQLGSDNLLFAWDSKNAQISFLSPRLRAVRGDSPQYNVVVLTVDGKERYAISPAGGIEDFSSDAVTPQKP